MLVLEIGAGPKPQAKIMWPDATIETLDADTKYNPTYVADCQSIPDKLFGKYDHVLASHVLEHVPYFQTHETLVHWSMLVKPGGLLHIIVPSLEWAAKEVLSGHPSMAIFGHLYGGLTTQWDAHYNGFWMKRLRAEMEYAGLAVENAASMPYKIKAMNGEVVDAEQHYAAGRKK